jgi:hypothetical protein
MSFRTRVVGCCEVVMVYLHLAVKDVCNVELRARVPSISNLHCVRLVCGAARQNRSYTYRVRVRKANTPIPKDRTCTFSRQWEKRQMSRNEISIEMEFDFRRRYRLVYILKTELTYIFPCVRALLRRQLMMRRSLFSVVKAFYQLPAPTLPLQHLI